MNSGRVARVGTALGLSSVPAFSSDPLDRFPEARGLRWTVRAATLRRDGAGRPRPSTSVLSRGAVAALEGTGRSGGAFCGRVELQGPLCVGGPPSAGASRPFGRPGRMDHLPVAPTGAGSHRGCRPGPRGRQCRHRLVPRRGGARRCRRLPRAGAGSVSRHRRSGDSRRTHPGNPVTAFGSRKRRLVRIRNRDRGGHPWSA